MSLRIKMNYDMILREMWAEGKSKEKSWWERKRRDKYIKTKINSKRTVYRVSEENNEKKVNSKKEI